MFFLLLIVSISLVFYHFYTHYTNFGRMVNKIPGPPIIPLVGNLYLFWGSNVDIWNTMRKINKQYSPLSRIWIINHARIFINHPDDAEILLSNTKYIDKSIEYEILHPWLKTGLLTSTGKKWQDRRKMLTPSFHFSVLQQFLDIFDEHGSTLVQNLKSEGDESVQELVSFISKYTLNTICETAMGTSLQEVDNQDTYRNALEQFVDIMFYRSVRPWLSSDWIFNFFSKGNLFNKCLSILHKFSLKIIEERKEFHDETSDRHLQSIVASYKQIVASDDEYNKSPKKRMAMLDHLIAAQKFGGQIGDEGIAEEVDTFIFEGHDTTAIGICFVILMLAEHKDIQDRVRKEVDAVLAESNGKIGTAEIQQFHYLEQCIKETLRLYPSVPLISRQLNTDLHLKNHLIPAGCSVDLHIYDLHRNENFWPEPEKFNPDRFSPERVHSHKRHSFSYLPFSAGPRNCIGQKFAMMEIKSLTAHFLHNFIFEPIDYSRDLIFQTALVMRPACPMRVKFITRIK